MTDDVLLVREWLRDGTEVQYFGPPPPPPDTIEAWTLKAVLAEDDVLAAVVAAMEAAEPRWKFAFRERGTWGRAAALQILMLLGYPEEQVNGWLLRADAMAAAAS